MNKRIGDEGEAFAAELLRLRGYRVREIGGNYPVIDLEVEGSSCFRVSVKTSASKRHVRMGREASVGQLRGDDFIFAFMPQLNASFIDLSAGKYDLLIIPGAMARQDALWVHKTYLANSSSSGGTLSGSAGVMVKSYSKRIQQREVWERWIRCLDNWSALPAP